jgi:phage/plasmid-associated DNA primase
VAEALGVSQKELTDNALKNINTEADAMYDFLDKVLLEYEQVNAYASAALVGRAGGKPSLISAAKAELTGEAFASSQNVEDIRTLRGADNFDKRVAQLKQEYLQR